MLKSIVNAEQFPFTVRQTETPETWEVDWLKDFPRGGTRRLLNDTETFVLQNGGERLVVNSRPDQENLHEALSKYGTAALSRDGDRYVWELIVPDENGEVHDDWDFRTPMHRISCPTCVSRIAENRLKRRSEVYGLNPDQSARVQWVKDVAEHSRLVGEAYLRLAEIELVIAEKLAAR